MQLKDQNQKRNAEIHRVGAELHRVEQNHCRVRGLVPARL